MLFKEVYEAAQKIYFPFTCIHTKSGMEEQAHLATDKLVSFCVGEESSRFVGLCFAHFYIPSNPVCEHWC